MKRWLASVLSVAAVSAVGPGLYRALDRSTAESDETNPTPVSVRVVPASVVSYGLTVTELPPHPPHLAEAWERSEAEPTVEGTVRPVARGCPVELRAIVAGGDRDGFAMVAIENESLVLRAGDRVKTALGKARVAALSNTHMTLTGGFGKRRCTLDSER